MKQIEKEKTDHGTKATLQWIKPAKPGKRFLIVICLQEPPFVLSTDFAEDVGIRLRFFQR